MVGEILIDLRNISYNMGGKVILDDITFSVSRGEIITMIGPNGSGKTTLAKIMLGILRPTSGKVVWRSGMKVGYAPQNFKISGYLPMTGRDFITSTITPGISLESIMELTEICEILDSPLENLSGGELKLIMLAKALTSGHDVLVLDELASCFDLNQKDKFYRILRQINERLGCAIVLVSHDLLMIMQHTDKVLCINKSLCCSDNPANVARHPAFIKLFGNRFQNITLYDHEHHCSS